MFPSLKTGIDSPRNIGAPSFFLQERKIQTLIKENITLQILLDEIGKIEYDLNRHEESEILQKLTHHQLIGLKYFEDILLRIPRDEIKRIEKKFNFSIEDHRLELFGKCTDLCKNCS